MSNYNPTVKSVIDRNTVSPPRQGIDPHAVMSVISITSLSAFIYISLFVIFDHLYGQIAHIVFFLILCIAAALLLYYFLRSADKRKTAKQAVYYLEIDRVTDVQLVEEMRRVRSGRYYESRRFYCYTYSFADHKSKTIEHSVLAYTHHDKEIAVNDECYLLFEEGSDKIIDIFDSKYYSPSPDDFALIDGKYYFKKQHK